MSQSIVTNEDCMVLMSRYPDKYFDLAVIDPPYGDGEGGAVGRQETESQSCVRRTVRKVSRTGSRFGGRFDRYKVVEHGQQSIGGGRFI